MLAKKFYRLHCTENREGWTVPVRSGGSEREIKYNKVFNYPLLRLFLAPSRLFSFNLVFPLLAFFPLLVVFPLLFFSVFSSPSFSLVRFSSLKFMIAFPDLVSSLSLSLSLSLSHSISFSMYLSLLFLIFFLYFSLTILVFKEFFDNFPAFRLYIKKKKDKKCSFFSSFNFTWFFSLRFSCILVYYRFLCSLSQTLRRLSIVSFHKNKSKKKKAKNFLL